MSRTTIDNVTWTVEIGFSTSAGAGTNPVGALFSGITWTDISDYVKDVTIHRGRSTELDQFTTGSATLILSSLNRRFDPENTAGPYYGKLTPMRPLRITATYAGTTSRLFTGFVDGWPQAYTIGVEDTISLTASDAFKVLNLIKLGSYWEYQIGLDNPTTWFRFAESDGIQSVTATNGTVYPGAWVTSTSVPTGATSAESLIAHDSNRAAKPAGGVHIKLPGNVPNVASDGTGAKTISMWFSTDTTDVGNYGLCRFGNLETLASAGVTIDANGVGTIRGLVGFNATGQISPQMQIFNSSVVVNDGKPHHLAIVSNWVSYGSSSNRVELYVDGVAASNPGFEGVAVGTYAANRIGINFSPSATSANNFPLNFTGTVDELTIWNSTALSAAQIQNHYQIGAGLFGAGDLTDIRVGQILDLCGWPSDARTIGTGATTVQAIDTQGKTALAALQECELAEQGRLFIDGDGSVRFLTRNELTTVATYSTSQATFGDSSGELHFTKTEFVNNDQLIFNDVTVGRANGVNITAVDATSVGKYWSRPKSVTGLISDSDAFSYDLAQTLLSKYKQPSTRIQKLDFTPRTDPSNLYPVALGFAIGTRVTVNRRPSASSPISKQLLVEGVSTKFTSTIWETSFNLSPVPPNYFVLGTNSLDDSTVILGL